MDNIIEGNRLISEFTNSFKHPKNSNLMIYNPGGHVCDIDKAKYHLSYDWLMPVVEKIENSKVIWAKSEFKKDGYTQHDGKNNHWYEFVSIGTTCEVREFMSMVPSYEIISISGKTKLESIWLTVVAFIKWYNN